VTTPVPTTSAAKPFIPKTVTLLQNILLSEILKKQLMKPPVM